MFPKANNRYRPEIFIKNTNDGVAVDLSRIHTSDGLAHFKFQVMTNKSAVKQPITLKFKVPAINVKGVWGPTADFSKRIKADWELGHQESRISIDAPVLSLFGNNDENRLCFSCSEAVERVDMAAKYREEDNHFYCKLVFFRETGLAADTYDATIRLDYRNVHFSKALRETAQWWAGECGFEPIQVPDSAKEPLYSTWYQFHQDLKAEELLDECRLAKTMGFGVIIIDDGWQTLDANRGYDHTGDWQPERLSQMQQLVTNIQEIGMKVGLWYSVPFCGKKSKAYQHFKGKFLTENHRWAPVFDPRYREVRAYLVNLYVQAAKNWGLDGFKLDFIDEFKKYDDTDFGDCKARDFQSINAAVDCLLTTVIEELKKINPEIFIEFRQKYTGPAMRKYGNMMRAFDCPGDPTMNRVRIADLKMLAGTTAVHSDMVTWPFEEKVETAALHYLGTLFGVPQISILLNKAPRDHIKMVRFFTEYWNANKNILLSQNFVPKSPLENYPVQIASDGAKTIVGLYADQLVRLPKIEGEVDILNVKMTETVAIHTAGGAMDFKASIYDCTGQLVEKMNLTLDGYILVKVPPCGLLMLERD